MMRKITFLFTILLSGVLTPLVWAQSASEGYKITGHIKGIKDTTCILAHYFGSTQYIPKDTAHVDGNGNMTFEGNKTLPEGLYMVVAPIKYPYIQFLMTNDQQFSFDTDTTA